MTRNFHVPIQNRVSWDKPVTLDKLVFEELLFWSENLDTLHFISLAPVFRVPEIILFTDASSFAGAAVLFESQNKVSHFMFNETDMQKCSTFRELRAVEFSLKSFSTQLHGKFVKLYTDNQNVVRIISVGSTVHDLQKLAISIFQICIAANVALEIAWVPRALNFTADHFSKVFDFDDWSVNKYIFTFFESRWGPHTCDRFANQENKKVGKFNSQFWCPGTAGVDAFAYDWSHDINWLVPPVYLIPQVLKAHEKL